MRVALNLVYLVPGETGGMEIYARELLPRLAAMSGMQPVALVNREAAAAGGPWDDIERVVVPVHARRRVEWVLGEQRHVPRLAARAGAELVHSLASTAPLHGPFVRVTTIHDLNYKLVPEAHFGVRGLGMRALVPASARRSHRILVDAGSTRDDLVRHLRVPAAKIDVVPLGVTPPGKRAPLPEVELRRRLDLGERPVLLSVSAKRPHKNLPRLLQAVAGIPMERRPLLVVPGYATAHEAELRALAAKLGISDDVRFPAWIEPEALEGLYALAAAVVFASLYEGFGLPVLEAMIRGVPVVTSDRSSLPEVAGDAAVLVDPTDVAAIRAGIERVMGDPDTRARLAVAGRRRAAGYTWQRTAAETVAAYERALRAR